MLQSSCLPFVLYASQRIACYFCTMKRFLLITIAAIFCSSATVCAQFNTVTQTKVHRKAVPKTTQSQHPNNCLRARRISGETLLPLPHYKPKRSRPTATRHLSVHSVISLSPALSATAETHLQKEKPYTTGLI